MTYTFTSLRHSVEKLIEAEYFLGRMNSASGIVFQFELNAFLSSSRSVTFVLQKSLSGTPGFVAWYESKQAEMRTDPAMRFFVELRNISQKLGPVSYISGVKRTGGTAYRFVSQQQAV